MGESGEEGESTTANKDKDEGKGEVEEEDKKKYVRSIGEPKNSLKQIGLSTPTETESA